MKFLPTIPVDIGSQKLVKLFTDLVKSLTNVLESSTYVVEVLWKEPIILAVPTAGRIPRAMSPDICRVARAQKIGDLNTPVNFGATTWEWLGENQIKIIHVDGLAVGTKYRLVFETVG